MVMSNDLPAASISPELKCEAPGRVNLIGEHTDYSGGFVMPAAIDFRTLAAIKPRSDGQILLYSKNMEEQVSYAIRPPAHSRAGSTGATTRWGVAWSLAQQGVPSGWL